MSTDASPLLQAGVKLFADDAVVQGEHSKWLTNGGNEVMVPKLFMYDADTQDLTITCLQAQMLSIM